MPWLPNDSVERGGRETVGAMSGKMLPEMHAFLLLSLMHTKQK